MKSAAILILLALAACSSSDELATCKGPVFALNAGHWVPATADLKMPDPKK